ncbi:CRP/FNR family transcriptional regulator, anaerobic regulatory protein [Aquimarina amphilecti]|uniref:CRP/FNR family transcriptional regulator, anaerobic regulatory protein n=1 Tax=Aquimarina amphilecti TaxID=1038014 RepID=A0A1H7MFT4_AQUAM|nr:Crp/Fnr family transcriptional regulator [Aquimarina amphilecti]SEL10190.1 CRP/FNR family transcriptional regulator, anaerobic regulatory protein [Aquimarina amphilecti]
MIEELNNNYGHFFEKELLEEISKVSVTKEVLEGDILIKPGSYIKSMPLIINGAIKILREDQEGDELLLYFLEKGDTCAMTLSCCMGHHKSEIKAIAEMDSKLIMIPIKKMEEWTTKYSSWRSFVFESYHKRLMEAIETIDSIAFLNMDERLLKYLKDKIKVNSDTIVHNTHQEIAYDLHTSRVVISRLLKKLEVDGRIELNRNSIKVISL